MGLWVGSLLVFLEREEGELRGPGREFVAFYKEKA